jgi:hypothetical protein
MPPHTHTAVPAAPRDGFSFKPPVHTTYYVTEGAAVA